MNKKNILKFISAVGIVVFFALLIPPAIGFFYGEDIKYYMLTIVSLLGINSFIFFLLKDHVVSLSIKESIISVNLVWLLLGIGGAIPFTILVDNISFADAFFESISGFTTTGATIFSNIEGLPHSLLFHRSLMHWLGGMGIIILGVGLLPLLNPNGSLSLFKAESTGISLDKVSPKIKDTAIKLWSVYCLFTFANFLFLMIFGMNWFDALSHALSTISTGGFSTKNASLGFYHNDAILWVTIIFMYISSLNFISHIKFFTGDREAYFHEEFKFLTTMIVLLSLGLALVHYTNSSDSFYTALTHASFTIVSVATTTGFATLNYETWGNVAVMIVFFAMVLGGNTGSTAGGIKSIRHIIFFKNILFEIKKSLQPDTISSIFIDNKEVKSSTLRSVFGFISLFVMTIFVTMTYLYARGYDEMSSISTAISMVGNIGPGFGLTGPAENYSFFTWYDKMVLSCAMIIGRLECYTVFIIFAKSFWKKF
ncbi:TrkH family potassium uptake protein [Sulfurospirillum arcachonense]|uniref:TrkH family potassium uptake protein n=1 Tax=Sulfurospirillum arcachonense TaxID=57666 RepID=UPI00046AFD86|nr:TrkH family potassium uptake protein [Sulfurospirillum arcachonense]